ncbi:hypothetical protein [Arsenicicoccus dermatophilus]|uniref:hypothetical protein n=1 Tax=Arsenicicoccus dermatophilus TaxID=1076331 RepID=UPI0039176423
MPRILVLPRRQTDPLLPAGSLLRLTVPGAADELFACEYALLIGAADRVELALSLHDAQPAGPGVTQISGYVVAPAPFAHRAWSAGRARVVDLAQDAAPFLCAEAEMAELVATRRHWDGRYALTGRQPLTDPSPGFVEWATSRPDDGGLLLLGDGEGRHARAVPARHPVTMVELSPVGAEVCRRLAARSLTVETGDAYRWLRAAPVTWRWVALHYLPAPTEPQLRLLLTRLREAVDAGGGCFVEMARFALPAEVAELMAAALGTRAVAWRREADDLERVRLVAGR